MGIPATVLLSVVPLSPVIAGGLLRRVCRSLGLWAAAAPLFMLFGAVETNLLPAAFFGIPERFRVFSVVGFNAVLDIRLFRGFDSHTNFSNIP